MTDNMFKTGAVMDMVTNAKAIQADTQTIEDAAVKNNNGANNIINMPRKTRTIVREYKKVGRNEQCPCGSGKKYKKCCLEGGTYERHHELTALEMANVKQGNTKLSNITKNAYDKNETVNED